jgi:hypothetical protein
MADVEQWDIITDTGTVSLFPNINRRLYRVPHDIERVNWNEGDFRYRGNVTQYAIDPHGGPVRAPVIERNKGLPEIYRLDPDHHVILDCYWQWIWRKLNPELSNKKWATLLGNMLAWTNNTGFPGHYDCINKVDTNLPFPRFDQARINGGAVVVGDVVNGYLLIETLLTDRKNLTASQILASPWLWFWGTNITPKGTINFITRDGLDGVEYPVRVPLLTKMPAYLPISHFHKLPLGSSIPDARWIP